MSRLRLDGAYPHRLAGRVTVWVNGSDAYGRHAIEAGDSLRYFITLPRALGVLGGVLSLRPYGERETCLSLPIAFLDLQEGNDCFSCLLDTREAGLSPRLYECFLFVKTPFGGLYAVGGNDFGFSRQEAPLLQLTVSRFAHEPPAWLYGGVIYHVFVDRFFRGGNAPVREGAVLNPDWEKGIPQYPPYPGAPLANDMFFGGDLYGVTEKLPYIASLGTRAIYLSPIFRAASNHKYDTGCYAEVDAAFGGEEALRLLIDEAKKWGIRLILDGVFNHTGDDSLYFNKYGHYDSLGAYQSKASPYASWYTFTDFPDGYKSWWGIDILPKLDLQSTACRDYFVGEDGIVSKYAKMGIGGMRLDVADELDGPFITAVKERLSEECPDAVLYGEVWEDASRKVAYDRLTGYYLGEQLDGVMNYPLRAGLLSYLRENRTEALSYYLREVLLNMPKRASDLAMNLLGTHDTVRVLTALGGDSPEGKSNDTLAALRMTAEQRSRAVSLLKGAYLILATLPGIPSVYYGDEVGAEGYADPFNRLPFPWHRMEEDLLSHYRKMAEIRRDPAYRDGEMRLLHLSESLLAFGREKDGKTAVTLFNNTDTPRRVRLPVDAEVLLGEGEKEALLLPPRFGAVFIARTGQAVFFEEY